MAKITISSKEIEKIINLLDSDGSGYIEYQEFLRAFCDKDLLLNDENLKIVFDIIDSDNKGYINIKDIKNFIMGNDRSKAKNFSINNFTEKIGIKHDTKIDFEKFCDIIRNTDDDDKDEIKKQKTYFINQKCPIIEEEDEQEKKVMDKENRRKSLI